MHALTHCRPLQPSELASNPAGHAALQQAIAQFDGGSIGELHSMQELECSLGISSSSSGGGHARRSIPLASEHRAQQGQEHRSRYGPFCTTQYCNASRLPPIVNLDGRHSLGQLLVAQAPAPPGRQLGQLAAAACRAGQGRHSKRPASGHHALVHQIRTAEDQNC